MLLVGIGIFCIRTIDVSLGTLRTISIVNSRTIAAFFLGLVEVSLWLIIISATLKYIAENPLIGIFYAFGFSTGNVVGIYLERKIPIGNVTVRLFVKETDADLIDELWNRGFAVTKLEGEGKMGPVYLVFCFIRKKYLQDLLEMVDRREDVFYTIDYGGFGNKLLSPTPLEPTGWRTKIKFK